MIRTFIDNIEFENPANISGVQITLDYTNNGNLSVTTDGDLEFGTGNLSNKMDAYNYLKSKIDAGNVLFGVPIRVYTYELNKELDIIVGYLNLWECTVDEYNRKILCPVIDGRGVENLLSKLNSVSFEYLKSIGKIKDSDIILSPYCIHNPVNFATIAIASLTVYTILQTLKKETASLIELLQNIAGFDPWVTAAQIITRFIYISALLYTLIKVIIDIFNTLIQPIKYMAGMTVLRQLEIGFNHFGYSFESPIFTGDEKNLTLFPEKYSNPSNKAYNDILGWVIPNKSKQGGWYKGYFGDFCQTFLTYYNAKLVIDYTNKIVRMVSRQAKNGLSSYKMPDIPRRYTYNYEDFVANYTVEFQTDLSDKNTIQEYKGTRSTIHLEVGQTNAINSLAKGSKIISIPFALFKVKKELSNAEKVFNAFFKVIGFVVQAMIDIVNLITSLMNTLIKAVNKIIKALELIGIKIKLRIPMIPKIKDTNIKNMVSNRIGCFIMESDQVSTPKLAYVKEKGTPLQNKQIKELSADYVFETYHSVNIFSRGNQYKLYEETPKLSMTFTDVNSFVVSNYMANGDEIEQVVWNPYERTGTIKSKKPYLYINNLKESKIVEDGR